MRIALALALAAGAAAGWPRGGPSPLLAPAAPEGGEDYYLPDATLGHAHRPGARRHVLWPEHEGGAFDMVTNERGLREDRPTELPKPAGRWRMLVLGDSHTDGVVANAESFPHLLEASLRAAGRDVEILNAGVGFYGPDQYARGLTAFGALEPDALLVTLFVGNDPLDTLRAREAAGRMAVPRPEGYYPALRLAEGALGPGIAQGLNQLYLFHARPRLRDEAVAFTADALVELAEACRARGIPLGVALLPSALRVEPASLGEALERALLPLDLSLADLGEEASLAEQTRRALAADGVIAVDLAPRLACGDPPCYWRADLHLSVAGHRAVADALLPLLPSDLLGDGPG